jgi:beta-lactamase class A
VCKYPLAYALVPLSEHLPQLAEQCGLRTPSIVITSLTDGGAPVVHAAYQGDRALSPASMIKLPIAAALCARWAAQESKPPDTVTITVTNMTANDAGSPLLPGYAASEEELGRLMLTRSDNVATNTLIDLLGREYINAYTQRIGLQGTALRRKLSGSLPLIDDPECTGRNAHPASDCAALLEAIGRGAIAGAPWLSETLAAQEWNEKLSRGLRPGDRFAHKTGDTDEVTHDGGILETSQGLRYVVVVYTGLPSSTDHDQRLCAFMKALRPHL